MRPYPWKQRKRFGARLRTAKSLRWVTPAACVVACIFNPIALIGFAYAFVGFAYRNDSWYKRSLIVIGLGLIWSLAAFSPQEWVQAWNDLLLSFGDKPTIPASEAVRHVIATGTGPALVFAGVGGLAVNYRYEWTSRKYLHPTRPTLRMRLRKLRNRRALTSPGAPTGWIRFGTVKDDPLPWRTPRYGMVVERPLDKLGHGTIVGATNSGKTVTALSMTHQVIQNDGSVLFMDCKGSARTRLAAEAIARELNVPIYVFDMTEGALKSTWYSPLSWEGSPSAKASVLMGAFTFEETGSSSYFTNQARSWMSMQFEVMEKVGLLPGESHFDFLATTSTKAGLAERIKHLKTNKATKETWADWSARAEQFKDADLSGLRANVQAVVNSAGPRLRPEEDESPIELQNLSRESCIIYIGLSKLKDSTALKAIGALTIKDLGVLTDARLNGLDHNTRPIVFFPDEASRMEEKVEVLNDLFALTREANVWVWPMAQSYSTWPEATVTEMTTNIMTKVMYRVQDSPTAQRLCGDIGGKFILTDSAEEKVTSQAWRSDVIESSGEGRNELVREPMLHADDLSELLDRTCYVHMTGVQRPTHKKWSSRRLKEPDQTVADVPLIDVVAPAVTTQDEYQEQVETVGYAESVKDQQARYDQDEVMHGRTRFTIPGVDDAPDHRSPFAVDDELTGMTSQQRRAARLSARTQPESVKADTAAHHPQRNTQTPADAGQEQAEDAQWVPVDELEEPPMTEWEIVEAETTGQPTEAPDEWADDSPAPRAPRAGKGSKSDGAPSPVVSGEQPSTPATKKRGGSAFRN